MKRLLCLVLGLFLLMPIVSASGAGFGGDSGGGSKAMTAGQRAKAEAKALREAEKAAAKARKAAEQEVAGESFKEIYRNDDYIFYLDTRNLAWKPLPYSDGRQMIEIWVKLIPATPADQPITPPKTYYLEHYYVRRDTQQIQFLCELEINGRPTNDVNVGVYDPRKWEHLVPGSIEESIYYGVNRYADRRTYSGRGGRSFNDLVEDIARVSI